MEPTRSVNETDEGFVFEALKQVVCTMDRYPILESQRCEEVESVRELLKSIWTTRKISVEKISAKAVAVLRVIAIARNTVNAFSDNFSRVWWCWGSDSERDIENADRRRRWHCRTVGSRSYRGRVNAWFGTNLA